MKYCKTEKVDKLTSDCKTNEKREIGCHEVWFCQDCQVACGVVDTCILDGLFCVKVTCKLMSTTAEN